MNNEVDAGVTDQGRRVSDHWSQLAVTHEGALAFLEKSGLSATDVKVGDLHAVDMLHMGGLAATDELAELAGLQAGDLALDVGCAVGGPARRLASHFDASVHGVELSERLSETAKQLNELVGLSEKVTIHNASALALPFEDASFDVVMMAHVGMQIAEKDRLFDELTRVVKPGGRLALHEIFSGDGELRYPLSWASEPSMSALEPLEACIDRLRNKAFTVDDFVDHSEAGRKYHEEAIKGYEAALARDEGAIGLAPEVVRRRMAASVAMEHNLRTGSMRVGMLVAERG